MTALKFRNNDEMPILGLGTFRSEPNEVYNAVLSAIKIGYRHIDCAAAYGNEKEVGNAISEAIKQGLVTRNDLWVTSTIQRGIVVIPKSINEARLLQNLETLNHTLTEEDMTLLKDLDKGHRFIDGKFWEVKNGPYTADSIWNA